MPLHSGFSSGITSGLRNSFSPWSTGVTPRTDITVTHRTSAGSTTDGTSFTTASHTPTANALQLLWVESHNASNLNGPPTVTGNSLTWVQVATVAFTTAVRRLTLFRALGAAPGTGVSTIDFGADAQTSCVWTLVQFAGVDVSGTNGSGAIVQSGTDANASGTAVGVALAALENSKNVHAAGVGSASDAITSDVSFTQQGTATISVSSCTIQSQTAVNQAACNATIAATGVSTMISAEIKAG